MDPAPGSGDACGRRGDLIPWNLKGMFWRRCLALDSWGNLTVAVEASEGAGFVGGSRSDV
jgi:hypothetical protein